MRYVYEGQIVETNSNINYDIIEMKYKKVKYFLKRRFINIPFDECKIKDHDYKKLKKKYKKKKTEEKKNKKKIELVNKEYKNTENKNLKDKISNDLEDNDDINEIINNIKDINYNISKISIRDEISNISNKSIDGININNISNEIKDINNIISISNNIRKMSNISEISNITKILDNYERNKDEIIIINYIKDNTKISREGILKYNEFSDFKIHSYDIVLCETFIVKKPFSVLVNNLNNITVIKIIKHLKCIINVEIDIGIIYEIKTKRQKRESKYIVHGKPNNCKIIGIGLQGIIKVEINL